jgi:hypothetical protein
LRFKPTPPSGPNGKPVVLPPEAPLAKGMGRVYVVTNEKVGDEKSEARVVRIGVTDGLTTEINGGLEALTKVVTDEIDDVDKKKKGKMF